MRRSDRAKKFEEVLSRTIDSAIDLANHGGNRKRTYRISAAELGVQRVTINLSEDIVQICKDLKIPVESDRGVWFVTIDVDQIVLSVPQANRLKGVA